MNLIQSNIKTMTLKEITDLLDVQHSKAMSKVSRMAIDPEFGTVSKMDIVYNDKGQTVETYILDKRQSMAVSALLNTTLLMRVIDRWQELEQANQSVIPQTYAAALLEAGRLAQALEETSAKLIEAQPKAEFYDQVTSSKDAVDMASAAKVLNMGIGRNKLFELLRDEKVLQGNNQPYQKYIDNGCFRVIESKFTKPNGDTSINLKTVVYQKGLTYISKLINKQSNKLKGVK
jgi:phage antirepressor YoqD-like protein